jgi:hypothetical protein
MSTPVYFFVATPGEALTMSLPDDLKDKPVVRAKNISPDIVGDLDFAVTGERTREPECVRDEEDAMGVFRLDEELVEALAQVEDERIPEIVEEWGLYEEELLRELRWLAQEAVASESGMYLCF